MPQEMMQDDACRMVRQAHCPRSFIVRALRRGQFISHIIGNFPVNLVSASRKPIGTCNSNALKGTERCVKLEQFSFNHPRIRSETSAVLDLHHGNVLQNSHRPASHKDWKSPLPLCGVCRINKEVSFRVSELPEPKRFVYLIRRQNVA